MLEMSDMSAVMMKTGSVLQSSVRIRVLAQTSLLWWAAGLAKVTPQ